MQYVSQHLVKGQAVADFLADHPCLDIDESGFKGIEIGNVECKAWRLIFDGSKTDTYVGAGIVIISPFGKKTMFSFQLDFLCTNNQAEYEALVLGLKILVELGATTVEIFGDSQLVIKQLTGEFKCLNEQLAKYCAITKKLLGQFEDATLTHIVRDENMEANFLAQTA